MERCDDHESEISKEKRKEASQKSYPRVRPFSERDRDRERVLDPGAAVHIRSSAKRLNPETTALPYLVCPRGSSVRPLCAEGYLTESRLLCQNSPPHLFH